MDNLCQLLSQLVHEIEYALTYTLKAIKYFWYDPSWNDMVAGLIGLRNQCRVLWLDMLDYFYLTECVFVKDFIS